MMAAMFTELLFTFSCFINLLFVYISLFVLVISSWIMDYVFCNRVIDLFQVGNYIMIILLLISILFKFITRRSDIL